MPKEAHTRRQPRRIELAEFLLQEIRQDGNGGLRLQQLVKKAQDEGFSEGGTRAELRRKEREGEVYADWDWRYRLER